MLLVFFLAIIITMAGASVHLSQQEIDDLNKQIDQTRESVENAGGLQGASIIFGNNLMICLIMFVPIFGPIFGSIVLYNTGTVIAAESSVSNVNPFLVFLLLFIFPFTWLEFGAYAIAMAESFWLIWRLIQGKWKKELVNTCILIAVCTVMLFLAAVIEVVLISALSGPASV